MINQKENFHPSGNGTEKDLVKRLFQDIDLYKSEIGNLQTQLINVDDMLQRSQDRLIEQTDLQRTLMTECSRMKDEIRNKAFEIESLKEYSCRLLVDNQKQAEVFRKKLHQLEGGLIVSNTENVTLRTEVNRKTIESIELESLREQVNQLRSQLQRVAESCEVKQQEINGLQIDLGQLKNRLRNEMDEMLFLKEKNRRLSENSAKSTTLSLELERSQKEVLILKEEFEKAKVELGILKDDISKSLPLLNGGSLSEYIASIQNKLDISVEKYADAVIELKNIRSQCNDLRQENKNLKEALSI